MHDATVEEVERLPMTAFTDQQPSWIGERIELRSSIRAIASIPSRSLNVSAISSPMQPENPGCGLYFSSSTYGEARRPTLSSI